MIKLIKYLNTENEYSGSDWNYEYTTKYIISINEKIVEVGYFLHFIRMTDSLQIKKAVIELPSSYGCIVKCAFCASSCIHKNSVLTSKEILELFYFVFSNNTIPDTTLLVTMTGIGDYTINYANINQALLSIADKYPNTLFTVSSCIWNTHSIPQSINLSKQINLRCINITFLSDNPTIVASLVEFYHYNEYDFTAIINMFANSSIRNLRINYLMIKGLNDNCEDFKRFVDLVDCIKNKVTIRISKMNNTIASKKNNLMPPDIKSLFELRDYLLKKGFNVYVFYSMIDDNMNCGQLITENLFENKYFDINC